MNPTQDKYRQEFEVPIPKKKNCLSDCFSKPKKLAKHKNQLTQYEIDYTVHIRAKSTFEVKKSS